MAQGRWAEGGWKVGGRCSPSGVSGVHRDEDPGAGVDVDLLALELEARQVVLERLLDLADLGRDDREHLGLNAVELIKAAPEQNNKGRRAT